MQDYNCVLLLLFCSTLIGSTGTEGCSGIGVITSGVTTGSTGVPKLTGAIGSLTGLG